MSLDLAGDAALGEHQRKRDGQRLWGMILPAGEHSALLEPAVLITTCLVMQVKNSGNCQLPDVANYYHYYNWTGN